MANLTSHVKAVHTAIGLPSAPSWAGYWNFVSATIILAFILYTAQKGTLHTWIGFFGWSTPQPVGSASATPSNNQTAVQQLMNGPAGNASIPAQTPGQATPIPWSQVFPNIKSGWSAIINPSFLGGSGN